MREYPSRPGRQPTPAFKAGYTEAVMPLASDTKPLAIQEESIYGNPLPAQSAALQPGGMGMPPYGNATEMLVL